MKNNQEKVDDLKLRFKSVILCEKDNSEDVIYALYSFAVEKSKASDDARKFLISAMIEIDAGLAMEAVGEYREKLSGDNSDLFLDSAQS